MRELSNTQIPANRFSKIGTFIPAQFLPSTFLPWRTPLLVINALNVKKETQYRPEVTNGPEL